MNARLISELVSLIRSGSPPCPVRSSANAATVALSRPSVANSTRRAGRDTAKPTRSGEEPTIWTSNREPVDWLAMTTDPMLAQSAVDRLTGAAHTLIIEGPSYRQRPRPAQRPAVDPAGR